MSAAPTCTACGRPMRPTIVVRQRDGTPIGPDGYRCVAFCAGLYRTESIAVQRSMIADMADDERGGWSRGGFTDPTSGAPLNLRQMFDRHAVCLAVCEEFNL